MSRTPRIVAPAPPPDTILAAYFESRPRILAIGRGRGLRPDEADDLAQDVFLDLLRDWAAVRTSVGGWLARTARRRADAAHARRRVREGAQVCWAEVGEVSEPSPRGPSPAEWEDALDRLPPRERRVVRLHLAGVPRNRIPAEAEVGHREARKLLARTVARLRDRLA